ncbi:MAG: hypothetical protein M1838_002490 [Thelocarpon superellum]|nr:MAG: hypothetical protein M1838_002490 [Thelocarpon superellum]
MSFINSVIAEIKGDAPRSSSVSALATNVRTPPSSTHGSTGENVTRKRKAEEEVQGTAEKASKPAEKTSTLASTNPAAHASSKGSAIKSTSAAPAAIAVDASKPPPRKGTFAEIMARAKAGQAAPTQVGAIKHKPMEKVSERQRRAQREALMAKARGGKRAMSHGIVKQGHASRKDETTRREGRVRVACGRDAADTRSPGKGKEPGYKGTAKTTKTESSYKGTAQSGPARPGHSSSVYDRDRSRSLSVGHPQGRGGQSTRYSHEEDEDEDVASDVSSDMEAGAFEVDEEEERALLTAKREDALAIREEEEHQRLKRARKLKLQALASKRH